MTTADDVRPALFKPTGIPACDRMESRIFEFLVQHVQNIEDPKKAQDLRYVLMAYGVAVGRHTLVIHTDPKNDQEQELFTQIARQTPGEYVRDMATAIQLLSQRMRSKLLVNGNGTPEGRHAQQVILEGGNP